MFRYASMVLLVEDSPEQAQIACAALRNAGYGVTWASSLKEACSLSHMNFKAIFLDLLLPETTHATLTKGVAEIRLHYPESLLIVLSAYLPEAGVLKMLRMGADFCIHKPLTAQNVDRILQRAEERHDGNLGDILARLEEAIPLC